MTIIATDTYRLSHLVKEELYPEKAYCREESTLNGAAASLKIGTVLGKVTLGAATTAFSGTGNGTITMDATTPVRKTAKVGDYTATCITAASDGGIFRVEDPDGYVLGDVAVAATFDDDIKFVIADGSTDFTVGAKFTITVAAGSGKYKPAVETATDGSAVAAAILMQDLTLPATTDTKALTMVRGPASISKAALILDASYDDATKKAVVYAALEAKGIQVLEAV